MSLLKVVINLSSFSWGDMISFIETDKEDKQKSRKKSMERKRKEWTKEVREECINDN